MNSPERINSPERLPAPMGLLIDRSKPMQFRFDGRDYQGLDFAPGGL